MHATTVTVYNNINSHTFEGELDLTSGAAVSAVRGDSLTATKSGTGTYVIRVAARDQGHPQVFETLNRSAQYVNTTPATALGVKITTVAPEASSGDILITLVTTATAGGTGAAADTTAAATISFRVTARTRRVY